MARLGTLEGRRVILTHVDIGIEVPLCDQSGTPIGYDMSEMFDPIVARAQSRLEEKARSIAKAAARYEPSAYPMPRIKDYRG